MSNTSITSVTTQPHAFALLFAGLITPVPAVWHMGALVQQAATSGTAMPAIPLWTWLLGWAGILQVVYAVYLLQLPDWSSLAVTAGVLVLMAATAAVLLGLTMFGDVRNQVLALLELTPDATQQGVSAATTWCLVLVCVMSLLALWFGQEAAEQRRMHRALRDR